MDNMAVCQADRLQPSVREGIERLLGRKLQDGEDVTILAFNPHPLLPMDQRNAAINGLSRVMDAAAAKAVTVPDRELEDLIDEATKSIRQRRP